MIISYLVEVLPDEFTVITRIKLQFLDMIIKYYSI